MTQLADQAREHVAIARQFRRWGGNGNRALAARHLAYAGELRRTAYWAFGR